MCNQLILGDNLEIMRQLPSESADIVYLDPPFFSNKTYEVIWGDDGEIRSFQDRWSGGIEHYIGWLKERVSEMHRLLKPTGSIFLHCDWHANAHIRVSVLDKVFGENNYQGEIIWEKIRVKKAQSKNIPKIHDTIWLYSKSEKYSYYPPMTYVGENYKKSHYNQIEEGTGRRYQLVSLLQQGQGAAKYFGDKLLEPPPGRHWIWSQDRIDKAMKEGIVVFTNPNRPRCKRYLDESETKGIPIGDIWTDIPPLNSQAKERIGYPTQKPEALLERIIRCASNEGDLVLDPFVGGGTTVVAADRLNRKWIGIDQSVQAIKITEMRLYNQRELFTAPFVVKLHKYDYDTLRYKDAFEFESWIVQQYRGTPNAKQRGDLGIDGKTREGVPIQVKRSGNIGRNVIDNFRSACERFDAALFAKNKDAELPVGILIAFSFGKGAIEEAARLKNQHHVMIRLVRVDEIVPIAKKPTISVKFEDLGSDDKGWREIEFVAAGESEAGIEMYAWDWNYDEQNQVFRPEILMDKSGIQRHKFKPGEYQVAVRVIDNNGLESDEIIKLKVNGRT